MHKQAVFQLLPKPARQQAHTQPCCAGRHQSSRLSASTNMQPTTSRHYQASRKLLPSCHKTQQPRATHHMLLKLSRPTSQAHQSESHQPTSRHTEIFRPPASSPPRCRPLQTPWPPHHQHHPSGAWAGSACSWWGACSGLRHPAPARQQTGQGGVASEAGF